MEREAEEDYAAVVSSTDSGVRETVMPGARRSWE